MATNYIKNKTIKELKKLQKEREYHYYCGIEIGTQKFKHRFNLYSIIWGIPSMIFVFYLFNFFINQLSLEWYERQTRIIILISLLLCSLYLFIRILSIFIIISRGISSYSQAKRLPIARLSYRHIKEMMKYMEDDFSIQCIKVKDKKEYDTLSRYVITYKNEEICGTWFCYLVLICGYYIYKLTNKFEKYLRSVGIPYFANKEKKKKFNAKVNEHTQKVINMMLESVDKMQKESTNYYNNL